jgi:perosamine synthetase
MKIPHSKPFLGNAEKIACARVIASGQLSEGSEVLRLEKELSGFVGHQFGVAVSSGTAALYLALKALDVGRGDSVIIPSYVCTAILNAVLMAGAKPLLSDVDPFSGNMSLGHAKKAIRRGTKAAIVPHLFGTPANAYAIELGLGIPVIEDCAQCVGVSIGKKNVGSLTTIAIFSFYATKLLCAGEGGMIAMSDKRLAAKIMSLREYDNCDAYIPTFNFKLSDVHAAIARAQLKKLPAAIRRRRELADIYTRLLSGCPSILRFPHQEGHARSAFFRFVMLIKNNVVNTIASIEKTGVSCRRPIFKPLHHYLNKNGFSGTDHIYTQAISLPIYPGLADEQVKYIVEKFLRVLCKNK